MGVRSRCAEGFAGSLSEPTLQVMDEGGTRDISVSFERVR